MLSSLLEWMASERGRAAVARYERSSSYHYGSASSHEGTAIRAFLDNNVK
jgi:hypothetical protein